MSWFRAFSIFLVLILFGCEQQAAPQTKTSSTAADTVPVHGADDGDHTGHAHGPAGGETPDGDASIIELLRRQAPQAPASRLPAGHPPIGNTGMPAATADPTGVALRFEAPEDWVSQPPSNEMRRYQYQLPGPGEGGGGELIVYSFSGGGPVAMNIDRWRKQFTQPDGSEVPPDQVKQERFKVGEFQTTLMEVSGQYTNSMMPGMGAQAPQPDHRMIGAIIETDAGPWFVKATGPSESLAAQREKILAFILSAEVAGD